MKNEHIPPNPYPVKPPPNMPAPRKESLEAENARLKAEVERLTKAGDAMIDEWWLQLSCPERMKKSWMQEQAIVDWLAAKEGKQS